MRTLAKGFYFRLAWSNLRHNRLTYLPQWIATAVMSGVVLLISGLTFSDGLRNLPTGGTAALIFALGLSVFAVFCVFFMLYINQFLIARRKREFGLYGILGLEKRHVARVLFWESALVQGAGVICGFVFALVFGQLLFWLLLRLIRAVPGSRFVLAPRAYLLTLGLFALIFGISMLLNLRQIRLASPMQLMQSERRGEARLRGTLPLALFGALLLAAAYTLAWVTSEPMTALFLFWVLVVLVILATYLLFTAGSAFVLGLLQKCKRFYYRLGNFVTVSGLIHRMRQNARGLASVCVLSTMLIVTVSGTLALYFGQEEMLSGMYPYDVEVHVAPDATADQIRAFEQTLFAIAQETHCTLSADSSKLRSSTTVEHAPEGGFLSLIGRSPSEALRRNNCFDPDSVFVPLERLICFDDAVRFDCEGKDEDCLAFVDAVLQAYPKAFSTRPALIVSDVFTTRQEGYGLYGGLLFLGTFFGLLFLLVTVLIIYFKQISEGYEDRARFAILQKVGMEDTQVRATINRQVLILFFLPLGATALHMVFASKIMARMLQSLVLYNLPLVFACIGGTIAVFALIYFLVYRLTARVYYGIVKW